MKNANTYHSKSANVLDRIEVHSIQNNYVTHEHIIYVDKEIQLLNK